MGQLTPTRQEIHDVHKALEIIAFRARLALPHTEDERDYEQLIRSFLPPLPRPTMAEVEWDDEKHYLAEAEDEHGIRMIMVSDELDFIRCMQPPNAGGIVLGVPKKDLTPTGRRYVLQEGE